MHFTREVSRTIRQLLLVATLVAGGLTASASMVDAQNLVPNGMFDHDITGWEPPGSIVELVHRIDLGSDLDGGSGPGCIEVQLFHWNGGSSGPGQVVGPVTPGAAYSLEGSYFMPSADNVADSVGLALYWLDEDGVDFDYSYATAWPAETDTWVRLSEEVIAPAGASSVWLRLFVGNPNLEDETRPGVCYFDDVWLSEIGSTTATQALFVPAAAAAHGLAGTYWSTNGWFSSVVEYPVTLSGALLLQNQDNTSALDDLTVLGTIPAMGFLEVSDMVTALGGSEVAGGIYLEATAEAAGLPATLIYGTTHTFTPNPEGDGGYGQGLPVVGNGGRTMVVAPGLYQNADFRTNVGVLNTSAATIAVEISLRDPSGASLANRTWTLQPFEQRQRSLPSLGVTNVDGGTLVITRTSSVGTFSGYTSTVDQNSGDAVYNEAR